MTDTTIHIGSIALHEPVTALTDYMISVLCILFYTKLKGSSPVIKNWKLFFLFFAISTAFAGTSHGFFEMKIGMTYKWIWLTGQVFSVLSTFYAQQATLLSVLQHSPNKKRWNRSYDLQMLLAVCAIIVFQNFLVVVINTALGLIPVMIFHLREKAKTKANLLIGYGISIAFVTAAVNGFKLSLHDYFNYRDIAHVLLMISLSVMYSGIKKLSIS